MKVFFRLLNFARPFRHYVPEYILWVIPSIVFGAMNFALLIPLLDVLFKTQEIVVRTSLPEFHLSVEYLKGVFNYFFIEIAHTKGKTVALQFICLIILISVFLANFFRWFAQRVLTRMRTWVVYRLRKAYFEKMTRLDLSFYHQQKKGNLLSVMSADIHEVENSVVSSMQILFRDPLQVIVYLSLLFVISVKLTILTLVFFPVSVLLIARISKKLRRAAKQSQGLLGKILNITEETLSGIRIIKAFSAEWFMQRKFNDENDSYRKIAKSMQNRRELASPLSEFLGVATVVVVLIFGGSMVLNNQSNLTAAQFITYIAIYSQIIPPIKNISSAVSTIQRGLVGGERVLQMIDTPVDIVEQADATELAPFSQKIEYQNVSFSYREDTHTLKNISFTLEYGKMIALVGKSGSGKSTTADLLCRFYDTHEGAIFIDNKNIKNTTLQSLRAQMGIVTQDPILFNDTVLNNIAFGMEHVDEQDVIQAAKIANAHEFIVQMKHGYQTFIGDRGSKLSGGQRQRLSIARAVLKNPPILILDEATSSLDTESERLVQESIQKLMQNRTTLVIAHRLSTIQHADEILVMQQGEIIERGTHEQLFNQNGAYRNLCDMQSVG